MMNRKQKMRVIEKIKNANKTQQSKIQTHLINMYQTRIMTQNGWRWMKIITKTLQQNLGGLITKNLNIRMTCMNMMDQAYVGKISKELKTVKYKPMLQD